MTRDSRSWQNVTPDGADAVEQSHVRGGFSHFDQNRAYAAVDRHRLDDIKPYIYKTQDAGKTLAADHHRNSRGQLRQRDSRRSRAARAALRGDGKGSFCVVQRPRPSGSHCELNLLTTPIRDLMIHGADLVAATHGRSFWILDDVTPLREASEQVENSPAYLFKPETAYRVRPQFTRRHASSCGDSGGRKIHRTARRLTTI